MTDDNMSSNESQDPGSSSGSTPESPQGPRPATPEVRPKSNPFSKLLERLRTLLFTARGLKIILAIGAVVISFMVIQEFFLKPGKKPSEKTEESKKDQTVGVKAFKVGRYNYEDSLNALGTIKGAVEFKLSFEIPGVVSAINYREGERYEEGALLISLKQDDILLRLKRAQAERSKAETALQIAQEKLKEHETLFKIGAIPQTTLDKVKLEVESARYDLEANELEVKANEVMLEKSNLYAPSAGTIGSLNVEEGEAITQNTLAGTHVSTDRVLAEFGVTEKDLNKLSLGQKAKVFVDAYADKTFEGTIESVGSVVVGQSRTATAKVRIENPENILVPGMFARVKILLYQKKNTLVVPTDSLQGKEKDYFVFLIDPDEKKVHKQPIVVGYQRADYAQVDSGVKEGDLIAISGLDRLEDETKVRIIETQEAEL